MPMISLDSVGPSAAARRLEISERHVRRLIETGKLPAVRTPIGNLISWSDVERLAEERVRRHVA